MHECASACARMCRCMSACARAHACPRQPDDGRGGRPTIRSYCDGAAGSRGCVSRASRCILQKCIDVFSVHASRRALHRVQSRGSRTLIVRPRASSHVSVSSRAAAYAYLCARCRRFVRARAFCMPFRHTCVRAPCPTASWHCLTIAWSLAHGAQRPHV